MLRRFIISHPSGESSLRSMLNRPHAASRDQPLLLGGERSISNWATLGPFAARLAWRAKAKVALGPWRCRVSRGNPRPGGAAWRSRACWCRPGGQPRGRHRASRAAANAPAPVPRKPRRFIPPVRSADSSVITLLLAALRQDDASPCLLAVRRDSQDELIDAPALVHGAPGLARTTQASRTLATDPRAKVARQTLGLLYSSVRTVTGSGRKTNSRFAPWPGTRQ